MLDWKSEKILVTGAAGFIGSHAAEAILSRGAQVIAIDNFDQFYPRSLKESNRNEVEQSASSLGARSRLTFLELDFCCPESVSELFQTLKPTMIVHLAARAGVRPSIQQPALYAKVNVDGTTILLEAAHQYGCRRFVLASSSSVYGNNKKVPFSETDDVNEPISPYAATKRACELIGHTFSHLYKLPVACLRFFTVFGPRQRPDLAISKFLNLLSEDRPIPMFGDGSTSRDYTFIDDIIKGVLASCERIDEHGYRIWNLGGHHPVSLREMIDTLGRVVGKSPRIEQLPMQPGDVERTYADLTRSQRELGFMPTTSFEDGVRRQWEWLRSARR